MNMSYCKRVSPVFFIVFLFSGFLQNCNYNYYRGVTLEEEGRFEEANIEFHRAYTQSPGNVEFRDAFERTADKTAEDLLERYEKYLKEKKYFLAFRRLEQAQSLRPAHPKIKSELKKWYRILLAGRLDLVKMKTLSNQIPLTNQIILEVRLNTPNITRRLEAPVDYQTKIFAVEDILYDPPQNLLMLYSINSVGIKLVNEKTGSAQFKKFVDFKTPVLFDVKGTLNSKNAGYTSVDKYFPFELLQSVSSSQFWYPSRGIRYSLTLDSDEIKVESSVRHIDFLPQILYINKNDKRYFLDFGHIQLLQKKAGGMWSYRRTVTEDREYLKDLRNKLLLNPYFYFREGGYPFVVVSDRGSDSADTD